MERSYTLRQHLAGTKQEWWSLNLYLNNKRVRTNTGKGKAGYRRLQKIAYNWSKTQSKAL